MDNRRTDTTQANDDRDLIEGQDPMPSQSGTSGGKLQEDIASKAELERVRDPNAREGVDKQDKIDHQQESFARHPADKTP